MKLPSFFSLSLCQTVRGRFDQHLFALFFFLFFSLTINECIVLVRVESNRALRVRGSVAPAQG